MTYVTSGKACHGFGQRRRIAIVLIAAAVLSCLLSGCLRSGNNAGNKTADDTSFYLAKRDNGADISLGENGDIVGTVALPYVNDAKELGYTGEVQIETDGNRVFRIWQEEDKGTQRVYLTTPEGTVMLGSWLSTESTEHLRLTYNPWDETDSAREMYLWVTFPSTENLDGNVSVSIAENGTIRVEAFYNMLQAGIVTIRTYRYEYQWGERAWDSQNRSVAVIERIAPTSLTGDTTEGTAATTLEIVKNGARRALEYRQTGLGNDGTRYLLRCEDNGVQTVLLQTSETMLGKVTVEKCEFSGNAPFTVDADNAVVRPAGSMPDTQMNEELIFRYNGETGIADTVKSLLTETFGEIEVSFRLGDEVYEGDRLSSHYLISPKFRKVYYLECRSEGSRINVSVPVERCAWYRPDNADYAVRETRLSLVPEGRSGWKLECRPAGTEKDSPSATTVGEITLGSTDFGAGEQYDGDVTIRLENGEMFRLKRGFGRSGVCQVIAYYRQEEIVLIDHWDVDEQGRPLPLTVDRFVEPEEYDTAKDLNSMFFRVRTEDDEQIAWFILNYDGAVTINLMPQSLKGDGGVIRYAFYESADGLVTCTTLTETAESGEVTVTSRCGSVNGEEAEATESRLSATSAARNGEVNEFRYGGEDPELYVKASISDDGTTEPLQFSVKATGAGAELLRIDEEGYPVIAGKHINEFAITDINPATAESNNGIYCPGEAVATAETAHLTVRVRLTIDYSAAQTTLDGTIVTPAVARNRVWLEITERVSGRTLSIPVGFGEWKRVN